jgi:dihydrofolate reductase
MGTLTLWMQMSLDGHAAGPDGAFDWPQVGPELHTHFNDELGSADSFVYGRNVYDGMAYYWPTVEGNPDSSPNHVRYAQIWMPMPKLVLSSTLTDPDYNTRVGTLDDVAALREGDGWHVFFGGPATAAELMGRDLIDEYRLFVHPVALGDGAPLFGGLSERLGLRLTGARTFDDTVVALEYARDR